MNSPFRLITSILLALTFAIKIVAPICNVFKADLVQNETQKETAPEGSEKDWSKEKFEIADINALDHLSTYHAAGSNFVPCCPHTYLPSQYFAVPTPPPWC